MIVFINSTIGGSFFLLSVFTGLVHISEQSRLLISALCLMIKTLQKIFIRTYFYVEIVFSRWYNSDDGFKKEEYS